MHLLRTGPLVEQLMRREVPAEERAQYLLASILMWNLIYYSGLSISSAPLWSALSVVEALAVIAINVVGIVKTFDASGGKANTDYVAEFTCLYVPVAITTNVVIWGLYWVAAWGFRESLEVLSRSHIQFALNLAAIGTDFFGFLLFFATIASLFITYVRLARLLERVHAGRSMA
jgi:hypothetical protein